jgi:hypothetical protein
MSTLGDFWRLLTNVSRTVRQSRLMAPAGLFLSQRTGSYSPEFHVPLTNCFVRMWFCVVHGPKPPLHRHNWLSFCKLKKKREERFSTYWYAPFCCVCLGCCADEFGSSGGTYDLPCIFRQCVGSGLRNELITRSEESYRVCVVSAFACSRSLQRFGGLYPNWAVMSETITYFTVITDCFKGCFTSTVKTHPSKTTNLTACIKQTESLCNINCVVHSPYWDASSRPASQITIIL